MSDLTNPDPELMDPSREFTLASAGYAANRLARAFGSVASRRLASHGINPGQLPALLQLGESDRTQAELAQLTGVEQPTMANTLRRMERDGLIVRTPDPQDGRRAIIQLTARAHTLLPVIREELHAVNEVALSGLSERQRSELVAAMRVATDNLTASLAPPSAADRRDMSESPKS